MYLKQHNLQVSGGKATLVARVLRYVREAQQILEPEDNDATSDSELQSSDSEDPDDSEDDGEGGGGGGVRHNFWEIWRGVGANLPLLRGGVLCNISPCDAHFSTPPPFLIIIAQSLTGLTFPLSAEFDVHSDVPSIGCVISGI